MSSGDKQSSSGSRLWEGRLSKGSSEIFSTFVDSIGFDIDLAPFDVLVSRAHVAMLEKQGIIDKQSAQAIHDAFDVIDHEINSGELEAGLVPTDEDVHTAIERRVTELAGDPGKALHTGRSRNDLVQMSSRLYVREALKAIEARVDQLIETLCNLAEKNIDILMPGKTHLQHAQPILLSHWLMGHAQRFLNDKSRIDDAMKRVNVCVLGAGAIAGSTLNLDSEFVAKQLGCEVVHDNSIFAVSTRDYIAECLFVCAQIVTNLSCLGEDIVWMTSTECGYATLDDQFSSGSSMMPQKKNPDIAELVRGKAGLTIGALTSVLATTKSQIFGYNHDLQVDKEALFSAVNDTDVSLAAMEAMIATTTFNKNVCETNATNEPLLLATDIAEAMVASGTPFRIAYKATAVCISRALENGMSGNALIEYLCTDDLIGWGAREVFGDGDTLAAMHRSIEKRSTIGGTATQRVKETIAKTRRSVLS
jgi:argininosuccinate lyase